MSAEKLAELTVSTRERAAKAYGFDTSVTFAFKEGGVIRLDGTATPPSVSNDEGETRCTIELSMDSYEKLMKGEMDGTAAFMLGKLKIKGDMGAAMKVQAFLDD